MNKLSLQKRVKIIGMLVEGNSLRAASRMADCSINTVTKLLVDVGMACAQYQDKILRNLSCKRIQCDEIWALCYAKEKNVPQELKRQFGYGDVYTWTAICADTKLVPSFMVGKRNAEYGNAFMLDLANRLQNRVQLTTGGHKVYLQAVENAFGCDIDYAMLVKVYGAPTRDEQRHEKHISTSYIERQNLTMRMSMHRFTILTNGFSKKIDNLYFAVALHFMFYNFGRTHKTLRVTPAMEAGIANHIWTLEEIVDLADKTSN